MKNNFVKNLLPVKIGLLFALLTLVYGFGLGGAFGAFEDNIKRHLNKKARMALDTVYKGDEAKMKKTADKSWVYLKRAHLHANGLGTSSLALILLLSFLNAGSFIKTINAMCLGIGSLGYSMFWMFAGLKAPGMGSTHMAKESLKWMAVPSAGLCITGVILVLGIMVMSLFVKNSD